MAAKAFDEKVQEGADIGSPSFASNASLKFVSTEALWDRIRFAFMGASVNVRHESSDIG
uniref:hypothetical protein n=1 Tax=Klebsiella pneumoniae TaxID=573 RepID=UPI0015EFF517|nr:hypothetical protein [Klebsiella pneumoniae]